MIYLDSAATGFLKPDCVAQAVFDGMKNLGNSGRGFTREAMEASLVIFQTREQLSRMFDGDGASQTVFTANATEALNTAIFGTLQPEREPVHVITTVMEHNSVLRPLYALREKGLKLTILSADKKGNISLEELENAIQPDTKAIVCTHASNLTGNINPIEKIGEIAQRHKLLFILDASQTAGVMPISMKKNHISILCTAGHKGLLGPQGTGVLCVKKDVQISPLKMGGTGIQTFSHTQPRQMPEALEAGTLNSHGIAGLHAALGWIEETGMDVIRKREQMLARRFYEQVKELSNVKIYGDFHTWERAAIVALNIAKRDSGEVSYELMEEYRISTRSGGHCAPLMHESLGTKEQGAVRFSFSYFNKEEEADMAAEAVKKLAALE